MENMFKEIDSPLVKTNPWPGLASYKDPSEYKGGSRYKFCGRAAETYDLLQLIESRSLVTLYGSTGIGKTSLLRAGVFPVLKQHADNSLKSDKPVKFFPIYIRLGAPKQLDADTCLEFKSIPFAGILKLCIEKELMTVSSVGQEDDNPEENKRLWHYFHSRIFYSQGQRVTPVIVLDQFEELFSDRDNDSKIRDFLKQLYVLVENRLPWRGQTGLHEATFRFVISLREDRFFYLEDCVDSLRLTLFKENRYRLHPMTEEQARQVITIPGAEIIDKDRKEEIADNIIEKARNKDRHDINTLMLSLICNQIFEKKGCLTLEGSQEINLTLDSYYQNAIDRLPYPEVRFIEKHFINGDARQPVEEKLFSDEAPEAYHCFFKDEDSVYKIITEVVIPGKDTHHVELVHDQLASVIYARQKAKDMRWKTYLLRFGIFALVLIAAILLVFWGQDTNLKEAQPLSIMRINAGEYSTTDSLWIKPDCLKQDAMVERLSIKGKSHYLIEQCPYLHTIDLSYLGRDSFYLSIKNCDVLKNIILPEALYYLQLDISNCPKLSLNINKGLANLYINPMEDPLNFSVDSDVKRYKESQDVLWDLYDRRIVFYPRALDSDIKGQTFSCSFPEEIKTDKLTYGPITLANIGYKEVNDSSSYSYTTIQLNKMSRADIDSWISPLPKSTRIGFVLPDSVDHLPARVFKSVDMLDSVAMPRVLYSIESEAFYDCQKLRSIVLSPTLIELGERAFYYCISLKHIVIPAGVTFIGKQAFESCTSLETVEFLGDSVILGDRAFANCINLKSVKLPKKTISYAQSEYYSPFYNSGDFEGKIKPAVKNDDVIGQYDGFKLAKNNNGDLIIRLSGNSSEIYLPIGFTQNKFLVEPDAHSLNHIHIPWPQPVYVKDGHKNELSFNFTKTDKRHITLHVPYGCKRYYEMSNEFADYRNIVEDPFMQHIRNWITDIALNTKKSISKPISIIAICFFVVILLWLSVSVQMKWWRVIGLTEQPVHNKAILYSVLFCIVTYLIYTIMFWFFSLYCTIGDYLSMGLSFVLALIMSSSFFLAPQLLLKFGHKGIRKEKTDLYGRVIHVLHRNRENIKNTIMALCGIVILALLLLSLYNQFSSKQTFTGALESRNYKEAIDIYADSLIKKDVISQADRLQMRNLLSLNGDSAQLVLIKREHYDKCDPNYELPWGVKSSISFVRNDSIFMYNTQSMTVYYYDESSDSSVFVLPQDAGSKTIKIAGKLYEMMEREDFIITIRKDGHLFIYDYNGFGIPYDYQFNSRFLLSDELFIGHKEGDDRNFAITQTPSGPVCLILPKGNDSGVYDKRYLIWKVEGGNTLAYDLHNPNNSPVTVDAGGYFEIKEGKKVKYEKNDYTVDRNRKDGTIVITDTKTKNSFVLPSRYSNISGTIGYGYGKGRYYYQYDYQYGEVALFDSQKGGQLIAEMEGTSCSFMQHPSCLFYTKTDEALQFYIIGDGCVLKTFSAKNNIRKEYAMESYYHFCGDYLIHDEDCNSSANHFARMVYSLIIPGARHIPIVNQHVFACGNSLIVVNPEDKNFYFYRYETLEEQLNRSKIINKKQKERLLKLIRTTH